MADLTWFDASQVPDRNEPVPEGLYLAHITDSKIAPTKSNPSINRLTFTIEILSEGPGKGKRIYEGLNYQHPNDQTREIAQQTLKAICKAVGNPGPRDTAELHNKPFGINVKVKTEEYNGVVRGVNQIRGYMTSQAYREKKAASEPGEGVPDWMKPQE
jgi:hypothetical protein